MREGPDARPFGKRSGGGASISCVDCRPVEELTKRQPFKGSPNLRFRLRRYLLKQTEYGLAWNPVRFPDVAP